MKGKSALYAVAVVLLMGSMAGVALADYLGMSEYPAVPFLSAQTEQGMEHSAAGEIREPVEAGAVPGASNAAGDEPTVEIGGLTFRTNIDVGP